MSGSSAPPAQPAQDRVLNQGQHDAWNRALALFRKADDAIAAAAHTEDEDLYDRLGERHDAARHRLLRTAAPHLAALALKLELALDERSLEFFGNLADMNALKRDARRLAALPR